jgi:DNA-directed RNA polymerase subunit RPC12/RpoP
MYAVVGCSDCSALWVVEGRPETTQCPRCGGRKQFARLKQFVSTDDPDHAKQVRAALLADRQDHADAFAELDDFATMETYLDEAGVDDADYLEASGIDADETAAAAERAGRGGGDSRSRKQIVRDALADLDEPTTDDVVAYASEHGVDPDYVERALAKLVRAGEVSESRGTYRLL